MHESRQDRPPACGSLRKKLEMEDAEMLRIAAWGWGGSASFTAIWWAYLNVGLGLSIPWWFWLLAATMGAGLLCGRMQRNLRDRKLEQLVMEALPEREFDWPRPGAAPPVLPPKVRR